MSQKKRQDNIIEFDYVRYRVNGKPYLVPTRLANELDQKIDELVESYAAFEIDTGPKPPPLEFGNKGA